MDGDGVFTARWRDVVRPGLFGRRPARRDWPYRLIIRLAESLGVEIEDAPAIGPDALERYSQP